MQATPKGSFGIPDHIKTQMNEQHRAAAHKESQPPQPSLAAETAKNAAIEVKTEAEAKEKTKEEEELENILKTVRFWEDQLEIKITSKDIQDYIFKGRLVKEGVFIAAFREKEDAEKFKLFTVTFQSHTPNDLSDVDEKLAEFRNLGKFTAEGIDNEKSLRMLSHVLLSADGRSLGKTSDERYKNIKNLAGGVVSLIAEAWDGFSLLIRYTLREKKLLKK